MSLEIMYLSFCTDIIHLIGVSCFYLQHNFIGGWGTILKHLYFVKYFIVTEFYIYWSQLLFFINLIIIASCCMCNQLTKLATVYFTMDAVLFVISNFVPQCCGQHHLVAVVGKVPVPAVDRVLASNTGDVQWSFWHWEYQDGPPLCSVGKSTTRDDIVVRHQPILAVCNGRSRGIYTLRPLPHDRFRTLIKVYTGEERRGHEI